MIKDSIIFRRFGAFLIDLLLINIIISSPLEIIASRMTSAILPIAMFLFLCYFSYFFLLEYAIGQTVGKILLNIKVVAIDRKLTAGKCFVRNLNFFFPVLFLWIADVGYMLFSKNQRFTEFISKTKVIKYD